jgi:hypothetical protein
LHAGDKRTIVGAVVNLLRKEGTLVFFHILVKRRHVLHTDEGIGQNDASIDVEELQHPDLAKTGPKRFRQGCQVDVPIGDQLTKCFVVDETHIEIVSTTVDDGFDGLVEVGLIEVGAIPTLEVFPGPGVDFVFAVNPQFGSVHAIEGRLVEKILSNKFIVFIVVGHLLFDLVAVITGETEHGNRA